MPSASRRAIRFVRALLPHFEAKPGPDGRFAAIRDGKTATLEAPEVAALLSSGVLAGDKAACRPGPEARLWLRRQLLAPDDLAAQHRDDLRRADGVVINLSESPLARLATGAGGEAPYLLPHHVEAGERVRRLTERAQLQPRLTMSYSLAHSAGSPSSGPADISDLAADARKSLDDVARVLPPDCAGVVLDVCGLLKGLQTVEAERGWPRRSAKLVLRIGLEQLARHFGLDPTAVGRSGRRDRVWLGEGARPERFG